MNNKARDQYGRKISIEESPCLIYSQQEIAASIKMTGHFDMPGVGRLRANGLSRRETWVLLISFLIGVTLTIVTTNARIQTYKAALEKDRSSVVEFIGKDFVNETNELTECESTEKLYNEELELAWAENTRLKARGK